MTIGYGDETTHGLGLHCPLPWVGFTIRHPCPASFAKLASGTSNHNPHLAGDTNSAPNPCPGVHLRTNPDASR